MASGEWQVAGLSEYIRAGRGSAMHKDPRPDSNDTIARKGLLMKAGIISSTPLWLVLAIFLLPLLALVGLWRWWRLVRRVANTAPGSELMFSKREARFVQQLLAWQFFFRRFFKSLPDTA